MQVKKYEAPTLQEALDAVKRELGPEAIILQTKQNRKGFGLMSKASVEVTAAVSTRSMQKKKIVDKKLPAQNLEKLSQLSAEKQGDVYDQYLERHLEKALRKAPSDQVQLSARPKASAPTPQQNRAVAPAPKAPATAKATTSLSGGMSVYTQSASPAPQAPAAHAAGASNQPSVAPKPITATRYIDIEDDDVPATAPRNNQQISKQLYEKVKETPSGVEEEIQELKRLFSEMKESRDAIAGDSASSPTFFSPALQSAFEELVLAGLERKHAHAIVKQSAFTLGRERSTQEEIVLDQIAEEIMRETRVMSILADIPKSRGSSHPPTVVALVGPTGVGKTTTLAKIASEASQKHGLKVGLINLDSYRVAAVDQLSTYARILNMPFRSVTNSDELTLALQELRTRDLILIDTTGRSQKDWQSLQEMRDLLSTIPDLRTELVLSCTTRDVELNEMGKRFEIFRPEGIIFSKLDEAMTFGALYNVSHRLRLPLTYFTTGQRVPEDIEEASAERVIALIMDL